MRGLYKKVKESSKSHKGITIIALVITIVVLLILAGVTIANISGNESVPSQAAKQRDKAAVAREQQILENAAISITNNRNVGAITENSLRDELSSYNVDVVKSGGLYRITFKDSNNLYKMDQEGEFFYWEDMAPTEIWGKIENNILYLRATEQDGYSKATQWNNSSITKVIIEEPIAPSTCYAMFYNCSNLKEIENIENLHTENVSIMVAMFHTCQNLSKIDLKYFDTSNVTTMGNMFLNCSKMIKINFENFDTRKVTNMGNMFYNCQSLKSLYLNSFDTSNVKNMEYMFYNCQNLEHLKLESFNTSNVENMQCMFYNCNNLEQLYLNNFNTEKVNTFSYMFGNCNSLNKIELNNFNTVNVQIMDHMFYNCNNLTTLDISSFDTSNVTNMWFMFGDCKNLKTIYASNKFVTTNVSNESIPNWSSDNTNSSYLFLRDTNLVGGAGTKYSSSHTNKEYARIDDPANGKPGYFTLKP